jgi:peptidoglycan hydrolase-like protein with peptidoglycan-binding domain
MSDPAVLELQKVLKSTGHDPGALDGVDGPKTRAALDARAPGGAAKVKALNLAPAAHKAALVMVATWPDTVFTSGRRGYEDQARAMAGNVVRNRKWIGQTYTATAESQRLQLWVSSHPEANTAAEIASGLAAIMASWTDAQKARLSRHFSGEAFDVQPVRTATGEARKATLRSLPGLGKFLEKEGGLVRWHAQFH